MVVGSCVKFIHRELLFFSSSLPMPSQQLARGVGERRAGRHCILDASGGGGGGRALRRKFYLRIAIGEALFFPRAASERRMDGLTTLLIGPSNAMHDGFFNWTPLFS